MTIKIDLVARTERERKDLWKPQTQHRPLQMWKSFDKSFPKFSYNPKQYLSNISNTELLYLLKIIFNKS